MNEILKALKNQKTTRRNEFLSKPISQEIIDTIKNSILKTPNASNRQSYSIIELERENADKIGFPGSYVFLFCIDFYRLKQLSKELKKDFDSQYLMQFSTALIDISLLAQSTVLAAQSLGLDTLITNEVFHIKLEKIFSHIELPRQYVFPMLAVCMGYSKEGTHTPHSRLNPNIIFHKNTYNPLSENELREIIQNYDEKNDNLCLIDNWREKGFEHYLEWFFDKWSPTIGSRKQSELFVKQLIESKMI